MVFRSLVFGTAGTPLSCKGSSIDGIRQVKALGLKAMELEFVRGVNMKPDTALQVGKVAKEEGIFLTAHAPYFVNLNAQDQTKLDASIKRILDTARISSIAGAYSITFHPAYYLGLPAEKVYKVVLEHLASIVQTCKDEGINLWIRPETTGKATQFGSFQELLDLSQELDQVLPCIDFAHLHARDRKNNTADEFHSILSQLESSLGREALHDMHIHMSGINYGSKGELNHLTLQDSDMNYRDLLKTLKAFDAKGVVISESPSIEDDALIMKNFYEDL